MVFKHLLLILTSHLWKKNLSGQLFISFIALLQNMGLRKSLFTKRSLYCYNLFASGLLLLYFSSSSSIISIFMQVQVVVCLTSSLNPILAGHCKPDSLKYTHPSAFFAYFDASIFMAVFGSYMCPFLNFKLLENLNINLKQCKRLVFYELNFLFPVNFVAFPSYSQAILSKRIIRNYRKLLEYLENCSVQ